MYRKRVGLTVIFSEFLVESKKTKEKVKWLYKYSFFLFSFSTLSTTQELERVTAELNSLSGDIQGLSVTQDTTCSFTEEGKVIILFYVHCTCCICNREA